MALDQIRDILGQPFYQTNGCLIYNMDCLQALRKLPDNLVWLTVTSPPYNIGKEYEKPMSLEEYLNWCEVWIAQIYQITHPNGAFWLNLGYFSILDCAKAIPIPYLLWNRIPFYLIQEIVWHYGAGVAGKNSSHPEMKNSYGMLRTKIIILSISMILEMQMSSILIRRKMEK